MRKILAIIAIFLLFTVAARAVDLYVSEKLSCTFITPDGWYIDTESADRIVSTSRRDPGVTIHFAKYVIEDANRIGSEDELREAIAGLYADLGIPIPVDSIKYSNEPDKATFKTTFSDRESSKKTASRKYLQGTIVRLSSGPQVLYLVIAQLPLDMHKLYMPDINLVMHSFRITDELSETLFIRRSYNKYLYILLIFALIAFFFARNRRIQKSKNPLGRDSSNFWRCASCGRVNHIESAHCHRCGKERAADYSRKR
jgi:hypothetical protein